MRTSVQPDKDDLDETDEYPDCVAQVTTTGELQIVAADDTIEEMYEVGTWYAVETVAE